jgi:mRNA interferase MazF
LKRGDIITVSAPGDYGKPRPAVVVQSDTLGGTRSVLVSLMTSTLKDTPQHRMTLLPSKTNGLKLPSQIMVDKIMAVPREKCGSVIGIVGQSALISLNALIVVVMGLAD